MYVIYIYIHISYIIYIIYNIVYIYTYIHRYSFHIFSTDPWLAFSSLSKSLRLEAQATVDAQIFSSLLHAMESSMEFTDGMGQVRGSFSAKNSHFDDRLKKTNNNIYGSLSNGYMYMHP